MLLSVDFSYCSKSSIGINKVIPIWKASVNDARQTHGPYGSTHQWVHPPMGPSHQSRQIIWAQPNYLSLFGVLFTYFCFKLYLGGCLNPDHRCIWIFHIIFRVMFSHIEPL